MNLGDPLTVMLGIVVAAALGGAFGFFAGTSLGRTRVETPLATTIELTREQLTASRLGVEKASDALARANANELAGSAMLVSRRLTELGTALARVGHKAKREVAE